MVNKQMDLPDTHRSQSPPPLASEEEIFRKRYQESFGGVIDPNSKKQKALELSLDIRKFEIELYWKRAAYFWAFTAASFAAYFSISAAKEMADRADLLLLVSCIGLVFSIAWYFVNRASKFWQNNWEKHVDLLEDSTIGPLYKTCISDEKISFRKLNGEFNFSVSKINQMLSLYVVLIFALLLVNVLKNNYHFALLGELFPTGCLLITSVLITALYLWGRTSNGVAKVHAHLRETKISDYSEQTNRAE